MPHFNAHSQEDPSQDSAGSFYKCLDQRPHCSRYIKIGNWAGQISPFIVFRVIAGCCDALRFMAPRDNSRFKFFFSSLRLLDITYFYPFPLLLELIRWTTTHLVTILYGWVQMSLCNWGTTFENVPDGIFSCWAYRGIARIEYYAPVTLKELFSDSLNVKSGPPMFFKLLMWSPIFEISFFGVSADPP